MTQSTGRRDAIKAILGLVPPRGAEKAAATANLDRMGDADLKALQADLAKSAPAVGSQSSSDTEASTARPRPREAREWFP